MTTTPVDVSPLITVPELSTALTRSAPLLLDVRYQPGRSDGLDQYLAQHLPGAVFVDLDAALSSTPAPDGIGGRHPAPTPAAFATAMRAVGVGDGPVVCYDGGGSIAASRCWWLLRHFGHRDVRVLDGGLAAWVEAGGPTEAGRVAAEPGTFEAGAGPGRILDAAQAQQAAEQGRLLDARPAERYRGDGETMDPVAGHIPGAVSRPAVESLRPDGRFLDPVELTGRLRTVVPVGTRAAVYCGSGVQATHLALALAVTGVDPEAAVYIGSFSDWISTGDRPVSRGAQA